MTKIFTKHDAVKLIYGELNPAQMLEMDKKMLIDDDLNQEYGALRAVAMQLDSIEIEPNFSVCSRILDYAKSTNLQAI